MNGQAVAVVLSSVTFSSRVVGVYMVVFYRVCCFCLYYIYLRSGDGAW